MIETKFSRIPVLNAMGQQVVDPSTKKVKTTKAEEVTMPFFVYNSLVSLDEYVMGKIEQLEADKDRKRVKSDLTTKFAASWRFILRRWTVTAPKGMRDNCVKIERFIEALDNEMENLINDRNTPFTEKVKVIKDFAKSTEGKKLMELYCDFMRNVFQTFGIVVAVSIKVNNRVGVRYLQFKLGTQVEAMLEEASNSEKVRIERAMKMTELRDLKLKAQMDNMGYVVESMPVYGEGDQPIFALVAYDPAYKQIPVPKVPTRVKVSDEEKKLIKELYPNEQGLYSVLPPRATKEDRDRLLERIEFLKEEIKDQIGKSQKFYLPGYGIKPDGTPEKTDKNGKPIYKYINTETERRKAARAAKALEKLQYNISLQLSSNVTKEIKDQYRRAIEPYIKGIYHPNFTTNLGNEYEYFPSLQALKDKIAVQQASSTAIQTVLVPEFQTQKVNVPNYPVWDDVTQKIKYESKDLTVPVITIGPNNTAVPHYATELANVNYEKDEIVSREIRDFGDSQVIGSGISRSVETKQIVVNGSPKSLIVKGRYAGYLLEHIVNLEGKFIEGGYINKVGGDNKTVSLLEDRMIVKDGVVQTIDYLADNKVRQRLIEPYVTLTEDGQSLLLGLPGSSPRGANLDHSIMDKLSKKVATIEKVINKAIPESHSWHRSRNPYYTFKVEDFELVRKSLGSVGVSKPASDFIDAYFNKLKAQEAAMAVENLERFTPASLGGFVKQTDRGPFRFNNKQLEALAWIDSAEMKGVVGLDTGVGKTVTALAAIKNAINQEMYEGLPKRKFLFVSPARLVGNLKKEIDAYMDEGGEEVTLADGTKDVSPNWRKILNDRVVEMSYDKYTETFQDFGGQFASTEEGSKLLEELSVLEREIQLQGRPVDPNNLEGEKHPTLSDKQLEAKKKLIKELKKQIRLLQKALVVESYPKADKYFQKEFYACFFDEVNEALVGDKRKALASLKHPRKVFLTASTMQKDPLDLYRFVTLAKGADYSAADEEAFVKKYGNVVGGRFVGIKNDTEAQREFYTWVKENAFFAFKESVNYEEVGLPKLLPKTSRTLTVKMPQAVQNAYKQEASKIKRELAAMLKKYRDLSAEELSSYSDTEDDDFRELNPSAVGRGRNRTMQKKLLQDYAQKSLTPLIKKLMKLSNRPESVIKGAKNVKVEQAVALALEYRTTKTLYFTADNLLAVDTGKSISKKMPAKVVAVCLPEAIRFYQAGKLIYTVNSRDNLSLEQFEKLDVAKIIKQSNEMPEGEEMEAEATWAIDISKQYINNNSHIGATVCTDAYAFGFNFQTFTKVIHLDRGAGFNSEVIKQRTARAYRAGQDKEVEEIFIDTTMSEATDSPTAVSQNIQEGDIENLSIDELQGLVAMKDQEFFTDIIRKSLTMDLTAGADAVQRDSSKVVNFTNEMLASIVDPTPQNITALEVQLNDFETNPVNHVSLPADRYARIKSKYRFAVEGYSPENLTLIQAINTFTNVPVERLFDSIGLFFNNSDTANTQNRINIIKYRTKGWGWQISYLTPFAITTATIKFTQDGEEYIYGDYTVAGECAPSGTGIRIMITRAISAMKSGLKAVTNYSALSGGPRVWPKVGMNGEVQVGNIAHTWVQKNNASRQSMEEAEWMKNLLERDNSILRLIASEKTPGDKLGERMWAAGAHSFSGKIDLTPGSLSLQVLNGYLKKKCEQLGISVQDYLTAPLEPFDLESVDCWINLANGSKFTYEGKQITLEEAASLFPTEFKIALRSSLTLREVLKYSKPELLSKYFRTPVEPTVGRTASPSYKYSSEQQEGVEMDSILKGMMDDPILDSVWDAIRRKNSIISMEIDLEIDRGDTDLSLVEKLKGAN